MARWDDKTISRRSAAAGLNRAAILPYVNACLAMTMPWRHQYLNKGAAFEALFDSTAPMSVMHAAERFQQGATPPGRRWFELEAGPLVDPKTAEAANRVLQSTTGMIHAVLDASAFVTASLEAYADHQVGTAALLGLEGDDDMPIRWMSAPAWALAFEEGVGGRVDNVFWEREFHAYQLDGHWKNAHWSKKVRDLISGARDDKVKVRQSSYYDPDLKGWRIAVQECGTDAVVWDKDRDRTNPWIIFRYWTTPGDPWGRGPIMLSLPSIRTANKVVEMILTSAAYALAPPLMVAHDGVVNPDTLTLAPRSLIRVARTGGPLGPSIAPMPIGGNVDMGNLVLEDQRMVIKRDLNDEQLPPLTGAVRSASEIIQRTKELAASQGAGFARFNHEAAPQIVARSIDLLDRRKISTINWNNLRPDQLTLKVKLTSPMARAQSLEDVQTVVQFWELAKGIGGDEAFLHVCDTEDGLPRLAQYMGVPLWAVNDPDKRAMIAKAAGVMAAHAMSGGAAATQPSPTPAAQDFAA